jgi:hypothetical protein
MNIDIRIPTNFLFNPKAAQLSDKCGSDGLVSLLHLWCWAANHSPTDGWLPGSAKSTEAVERLAFWYGRKGELVAALISIGFIDQIGDWLQLHEWATHQPFCAEAEQRIADGRKGGIASGAARRKASTAKLRPVKSTGAKS